MSKARKSTLRTERSFSTKSNNSNIYRNFPRILFIGSLTAGLVGSFFIGLTVYFFPYSNPFNFFNSPGFIAGIVGAFIGFIFHQTNASRRKSENLYIIISAIITSIIVDLIIFTILIKLNGISLG